MNAVTCWIGYELVEATLEYLFYILSRIAAPLAAIFCVVRGPLRPQAASHDLFEGHCVPKQHLRVVKNLDGESVFLCVLHWSIQLPVVF